MNPARPWNENLPSDPYTADSQPRRRLPQGTGVALAAAAYMATMAGVLWLANLIGPTLPWFWWQHTNATVLHCQEMVVPGKSPTPMDHCIVGWNHKIVVLTSIQGNAYKNVTDEATLDWLGHGAHPVGSTVAIGIHGNTAATVETITEQGKEAAVYLVMFLAAITAALIWFGWWRLRSRRAHPATGHEPRSPDR